MASYENEQRTLQKLMEEVLSDEEDEPFQASSDEYEPDSSHSSSYSSADSDEPLVKKKKTSTYKTALSGGETLLGEGCSRQLPEVIDNLASPNDLHRNDPVSETIEAVINQFQVDSSDEDEECLVQTLTWQVVTGQHLKDFQFDAPEKGVSNSLFEHADKPPVFFFKLIVDEDLVDHIVTETNRYASQRKGSTQLKWARINKWKDTNSEEIMVFVGLQIWMGLFRAPKLADYWSKKKIYANQVATVMSRNRFELLLANWHFQDNQEADTSDRLYKLGPLINCLKKIFKNSTLQKSRYALTRR